MIKQKYLVLPYEIVDREDLSDVETDLLTVATLAREEAYAGVSNFMVGAAIRLKNGETVRGWNMEDIVHSAMHSENNAIGRMDKMMREIGMELIAVVGGPAGQISEDFVTPCGHCRQRLLEFKGVGNNPTVLSAGIRGKIMRVALLDLLPFAFYPDVLTDKMNQSGKR